MCFIWSWRTTRRCWRRIRSWRGSSAGAARCFRGTGRTMRSIFRRRRWWWTGITRSVWAAGRCCTTASMWAKRSCTRRRTTRSCRRSRGRRGTRRRARRFWCRRRCVRPRVSEGCMTTGSIRSSLTGCFPSRARSAGTAILTSARARRSRSTGWIRPS